MSKIFASVLIAAAVALSASAAQTMPFASDRAQDNLVVPVTGKCGIGRYRGPDGVCRRKYYFGNYGSKQYYGTCGGIGAHRVCNFVGQCWMSCD